MTKIKSIWQVVREYWERGKAGFALFLISLFVNIYGYIALNFELAQGWKGHVSIQNVMKDVSSFVPVGGALVGMIIGGIDFMMLLADFIQARREKKLAAAVAAATEEATEKGMAVGIAKGIAEGRAKGIAEGRAEGRAEVYREIEAWNRRRKEAEEQGVEFTEPPPTQPKQTSSD